MVPFIQAVYFAPELYRIDPRNEYTYIEIIKNAIELFRILHRMHRIVSSCIESFYILK